MDTVSYSKEEKIRLLRANGYVVRKEKVTGFSKESFAFKAGRKYNIDPAFDSTVKNILLMMNLGGEEEEEQGFYTPGVGIDITGAVISLSHLGIEDLGEPTEDKILFYDHSAGAVGWTNFEEVSDKIKISSNDTTPGYLEDKLGLSYGENTANILELGTINEGGNEVFQFQLDESKISHDNIADVSADDHHNQVHTLATTGPHTGSLPLTDLAPGTAGDIITRQVTDWAVLAKGTENYVLKMGATYPAWGTVDWSDLTGTQPVPIAHAMDSATYHTSSDITILNATTSKHGFLPKLGGGTTNYLRADGTWVAPPGSGMVYPGAGIALSTGSAWGTSITNASGNWNTAYAYSQIGHLPLTGGTLSNRLIIDKSVAGDGGWDDAGILIRNNNATAGETALAMQNISTGSNYWIQGLNQSEIYKWAYGSSFTDGFVKLALNADGNLTVTNNIYAYHGEFGVSENTEGVYVKAINTNTGITAGARIIAQSYNNNIEIASYGENHSVYPAENHIYTGYVGGKVNIGSFGVRGILFTDGGSVELYHNDLKKFETTAAGVTITGAVIWTSGGSVNANTAYTHSQIAGGNSVHVSTTENTNWDAAYAHVSDNTQAHTDYMLNTGDTASGNYNFDNNTLVVDSATNRVGFGIAVPLANIHVVGVNTIMFKSINTGSSSSSAGSGAIFGSNDGAALGLGHRLGFFLFSGSKSATLEAYAAGMTCYATELWNTGATGAELRWETTANGGISRTTKMTLSNDGNVVITGYAQAANYRSSDGSPGVTTTVEVVGTLCNDSGTIKQRTRTITIKDGLITSIGTLGVAQAVPLCPA